jgi:hypothetical protein
MPQTAPSGHCATITTTADDLTEFTCCAGSTRTITETWQHNPTPWMTSATASRQVEPYLDVFRRIATHLTDNRQDQRTRTVLEGAEVQVITLDNVAGGIRVIAQFLPGINVTEHPQ